MSRINSLISNGIHGNGLKQYHGLNILANFKNIFSMNGRHGLARLRRLSSRDP